MRVHLLQLDLDWENPLANQHRIGRLLDQVPEADLLVLPEMWNTGFSMEASRLAETMQGPSIQWMKELALKRNAVVIGSLIIEESGSRYFNRALAISPDGILGQYDKRHTFRMAGEHEVFDSGTEQTIISWKGWKICLQVCYDLRFPVWSRNRVNADGELEYEVLVYVANWPKARVSHWDALLQARAIENQSYVIGVNRAGTDGNGIYYPGHSAVHDPLGKSLVASDTSDERLLSATLDKEMMVRYRKKFPAWQDADAFELGGVPGRK
ncbi:MAG: amidohydrolase [Bacteroidota bacterium]